MTAVPAFLGIWLMSLLVAQLAALQLGDFFRANNEFPVIMLTLFVFGTVTMPIFGAAYAWARQVRILHWTAIVLALFAFAPFFTPRFIQRIADHSTNPHTVGIENKHIVVELVIPGVLSVLTQWGLVRRRWLRVSGDDDFTLWPWLTTVVGGIVVLNPLGLAFLKSAIWPSGGDLLTDLFRLIVQIAVSALVVMALIECYIRSRRLRRRRAAALPRDESGAQTRAGMEIKSG